MPWNRHGDTGKDEARERALVPSTTPPPDLSIVSPKLVQQATDAIRDEYAPTTRRVYDSLWEVFKAFARGIRADFLPADPATVVLFLTAMAKDGIPKRGRRKGRQGFSMTALRQARSAIAWAHHEGLLVSPTDHPTVKKLLRGLARSHGEPTRRAKPLMPEILAAIVRKLEGARDRIQFLRDRALLLGGFAGALRRAELVALLRKDVTSRRDGLVFRVYQQQGATIETTRRGTKTDKEARGSTLDFEIDEHLRKIGACPILALHEWSSESGGQPESFFFRGVREDHANNPKAQEGMPPILDRAVSAQKVSRLVAWGVKSVGLDPDEYSAHSLRAGLATYWIYERNMHRFDVRKYMRHASIEMLEKYVRDWDEMPKEASS